MLNPVEIIDKILKGLGWLLIVTGIVIGLYVGGWVCLVGGITDIVVEVRAGPVDATSLIWELVGVLLTGIGCLFAGGAVFLAGHELIDDSLL